MQAFTESALVWDSQGSLRGLQAECALTESGLFTAVTAAPGAHGCPGVATPGGLQLASFLI
jgi:hypothetical protein